MAQAKAAASRESLKEKERLEKELKKAHARLRVVPSGRTLLPVQERLATKKGQKAWTATLEERFKRCDYRHFKAFLSLEC